MKISRLIAVALLGLVLTGPLLARAESRPDDIRAAREQRDMERADRADRGGQRGRNVQDRQDRRESRESRGSPSAPPNGPSSGAQFAPQDNRSGNARGERLSPDERRALRRQINEAGREVYQK